MTRQIVMVHSSRSAAGMVKSRQGTPLLYRFPGFSYIKYSGPPTRARADRTLTPTFLLRNCLGAMLFQRSGQLCGLVGKRLMLQEVLKLSALLSLQFTLTWILQFMKTKVFKASSRIPTPALEKGLDILELLPASRRDSQRTWHASLAVRFQRSFGCWFASKNVVTLAEPEQRTIPSPPKHPFRLAQEHLPIKRMTMQALPIMQQVAHELSQSCHLGVLNGAQVVIIAQVDSPVSPGFYVKAGAVVDLMRAATGHVILAHRRLKQVHV